MAKLQEIYNQQGFLSALSVLNENELREARHAFSELEEEFGKYHWMMKEDEEGRDEKGHKLVRKSRIFVILKSDVSLSFLVHVCPFCFSFHIKLNEIK